MMNLTRLHYARDQSERANYSPLLKRDSSLHLRSFNEVLQDSFFKNSPFRLNKEYSFEKFIVPSSSYNLSRTKIDNPKKELISVFEEDLSNHQKPTVNKPPVRNLIDRKQSVQENLGKRPSDYREDVSDFLNLVKHNYPLVSQPKQCQAEPINQAKILKIERQSLTYCDDKPCVIVNTDNSEEFHSDSGEQAELGLFLTEQDLVVVMSNLSIVRFGHSNSCQSQMMNLKEILDLHDNEKAIFSKRRVRTYLCKYCGASFKSGCALGGHISKIHRGVNLEYSMRMKHRKEQKIERDRSNYFREVFHPCYPTRPK